MSKVAIPPAWTNVKRIKNSHILVIGYDSKGKEQRIYTPEWIAQRKKEKFQKHSRLMKKYSTYDRKLNNILKSDIPFNSKEKVMAFMCKLMEKLNIRIGNECYLKENETYGLTTLMKSNFHFKKGIYYLEFVGKKGITHTKVIKDQKTIEYLKNLIKFNKKIDYLFSYMNQNGIISNVDSQDLNAFIKSILGDEFSAKDIRTFSANKIFNNFLKKSGYSPNLPETNKKKIISLAVKETADQLGNTPTVCRKHYLNMENI